MDATERIKGKRILIVDDEKDVLDTLVDFLSICKIDTALSFNEARELLENNDYDVAILDIMGVNGFELLEIAKERKIPALMLTAHGLSEENLKKSAEEGAAYYAPKEKMHEIDLFVSDVIEAGMKKKSAWERVFDRLGNFYDKKFGGTDWREKEKDFWDKKLKQMSGL
ncbi:MAG TPA: response regulator [Desulfobacteraceae bacterium]|nr:response regulator [Desulfobacteraceae bacterium]